MNAQDQIIYREALETFRRKKPSSIRTPSAKYSLIATDFKLSDDWEFGDFTIHKSREFWVHTRRASVSLVTNPPWARSNAVYFAIALASVLSFSTGRRCKALREDFLNTRLTQELYQEGIPEKVAIEDGELIWPVMLDWVGDPEHLSNQTEKAYHADCLSLVNNLQSSTDAVYGQVMRAIRLNSLSLTLYREDFGAAYQLIIASIEVIASMAISTDEVPVHLSVMQKKERESAAEYAAKVKALEDEWAALSATDLITKKLYKEYKVLKKNQSKSAARFAAFLVRYVPIEEWPETLRHPRYVRFEDMEQSWNEAFPDQPPKLSSSADSRRAIASEIAELDNMELTKILKKSYLFRSKYVHEGRDPPMESAHSSLLFDKVMTEKMKKKLEEYAGMIVGIPRGVKIHERVASYDLLLELARVSTVTWLNKESEQQQS